MFCMVIYDTVLLLKFAISTGFRYYLRVEPLGGFMKNYYNCCNDLNETVAWFKDLKASGVSGEEVLDVLEFDENQYPNMEVLEKARQIVFGI